MDRKVKNLRRSTTGRSDEINVSESDLVKFSQLLKKNDPIAVAANEEYNKSKDLVQFHHAIQAALTQSTKQKSELQKLSSGSIIDNASLPEKKTSSTMSSRICSNYLRGQCRFGNKCFHLHTIPEEDKSKVNDSSVQVSDASVPKTDTRTLSELKKQPIICKIFLKEGYCRFETKCRYVHQEQEQPPRFSHNNNDSKKHPSSSIYSEDDVPPPITQDTVNNPILVKPSNSPSKNSIMALRQLLDIPPRSHDLDQGKSDFPRNSIGQKNVESKAEVISPLPKPQAAPGPAVNHQGHEGADGENRDSKPVTRKNNTTDESVRIANAKPKLPKPKYEPRPPQSSKASSVSSDDPNSLDKDNEKIQQNLNENEVKSQLKSKNQHKKADTAVIKPNYAKTKPEPTAAVMLAEDHPPETAMRSLQIASAATVQAHSKDAGQASNPVPVHAPVPAPAPAPAIVATAKSRSSSAIFPENSENTARLRSVLDGIGLGLGTGFGPPTPANPLDNGSGASSEDSPRAPLSSPYWPQPPPGQTYTETSSLPSSNDNKSFNLIPSSIPQVGSLQQQGNPSLWSGMPHEQIGIPVLPSEQLLRGSALDSMPHLSEFEKDLLRRHIETLEGRPVAAPGPHLRSAATTPNTLLSDGRTAPSVSPASMEQFVNRQNPNQVNVSSNSDRDLLTVLREQLSLQQNSISNNANNIGNPSFDNRSEITAGNQERAGNGQLFPLTSPNQHLQAATSGIELRDQLGPLQDLLQAQGNLTSVISNFPPDANINDILKAYMILQTLRSPDYSNFNPYNPFQNRPQEFQQFLQQQQHHPFNQMNIHLPTAEELKQDPLLALQMANGVPNPPLESPYAQHIPYYMHPGFPGFPPRPFPPPPGYQPNMPMMAPPPSASANLSTGPGLGSSQNLFHPLGPHSGYGFGFPGQPPLPGFGRIGSFNGVQSLLPPNFSGENQPVSQKSESEQHQQDFPRPTFTRLGNEFENRGIDDLNLLRSLQLQQSHSQINPQPTTYSNQVSDSRSGIPVETSVDSNSPKEGHLESKGIIPDTSFFGNTTSPASLNNQEQQLQQSLQPEVSSDGSGQSKQAQALLSFLRGGQRPSQVNLNQSVQGATASLPSQSQTLPGDGNGVNAAVITKDSTGSAKAIVDQGDVPVTVPVGAGNEDEEVVNQTNTEIETVGPVTKKITRFISRSTGSIICSKVKDREQTNIFRPHENMLVRWRLPDSFWHERDPQPMSLTIALFRYGSPSNQNNIFFKKLVIRNRNGGLVCNGEFTCYSPKDAGTFVFRIFDSRQEFNAETFAMSQKVSVEVWDNEVTASLRRITELFEDDSGKNNIPRILSQLQATMEGARTRGRRLINIELFQEVFSECLKKLLSIIQVAMSQLNEIHRIETDITHFNQQLAASISGDDNNEIIDKEELQSRFKKFPETLWMEKRTATRIHTDAMDALSLMKSNHAAWELLDPDHHRTISSILCFFCSLQNRFFESPENIEQSRFERLKFIPSLPGMIGTPSVIPAVIQALNRSINDLLPSLWPSHDFNIKREGTRLRIQLLIEESNLLPVGTEVFMYGSSRNSFGSDGSDLDMCLIIPTELASYVPGKIGTVAEGSTTAAQQGQGNASVDGLDRKNIIEKLGEYLSAHGGMTDLEVRSTARIPIVRFKDPKSGLDCDLSFNNPLVIRNTALLNTYARVDDRVRALAFLVKYWAKMRKINDPQNGTLSSYGYILCVIYFLQTRNPPLLPSLQLLPQDWQGQQLSSSKTALPVRWEVNPVDNYRCNTYFYQPPASNSPEFVLLQNFSSKNQQTVGELLAEFFFFFAWRFDYRREVVCVRKASPVLKLEKAESCCWLPFDQFSIEDPFETHFDVAHVLRNGKKDALIRNEMVRAYSLVRRAGIESNLSSSTTTKSEVIPRTVSAEELLSIILQRKTEDD